MRSICCPDCGKFSGPTPAEDVAQGKIARRTYGKVAACCCCDYCGKELNRGDEVICITVPAHTIGSWEKDYLL